MVGWEGMYEVSNLGRVKSLARMVTAGGRSGVTRHINLPNRIVSGSTLKTGHILVALSLNGKVHHRYVHRLVLEAFVGPAPQGHECCHYNGNGSDNRLENLRWDTRSANHLDKVRHGHNQFALRTHCPQGHEYTEQNTYRYPNGSRACRACRAVSTRENNEKRKKHHT